MNIEREVKVRDAIRYCIENFDSQTATNRIVEFWKDELKLQEQQCNIADVSSRFYALDERGVRAFVRYSTASGGWAIECYRKKRKDESEGEHDWKMIREGHIQSYGSRQEAELKALKLAEEVCLENGY